MVEGIARVRRLMTLATGDEKHKPSADSTLDVLWTLYDRVLRTDPANPRGPDRDRFILSKGHGPISLYAILAAKGFFPEEELRDFLGWESKLGNHPDRLRVPGVEASTGSLGHGLPMGIGVALALRACGLYEQRVFVLVGDGELNEGSNWEALMLAAHLRLSNLTCIVIDNRSSTIDLGDIGGRLSAFGWETAEVDGRDHEALEAALRPRTQGPRAVVARIR